MFSALVFTLQGSIAQHRPHPAVDLSLRRVRKDPSVDNLIATSKESDFVKTISSQSRQKPHFAKASFLGLGVLQPFIKQRKDRTVLRNIHEALKSNNIRGRNISTLTVHTTQTTETKSLRLPKAVALLHAFKIPILDHVPCNLQFTDSSNLV